MRSQSLEFRSENQRLPSPPPIERLFAHPVTCERQPLFRAIPEGYGKHAFCSPKGFVQPPMYDSREKRLGVGMSTPTYNRSDLIKLLAYVEVIIYFPVEREHISTTR